MKARLSLFAALLAAPSLHAELLSTETFSAYPAGMALPAQDPTIAGYVGPWTGVAFGNAPPAVIAGSLAYDDPAYVAGTGHHAGKGADTAGIQAGNSGRVERLLDAPLAVDNTTTGTLYLSWLFQTGDENAADNPDVYQTLALWNGTGATDTLRDFEAGVANGDFPTPNFGFRVDNNSPVDLGIPRDADVHLFVVKFVLSDAPAGDSVTVWLDPELGAGEPEGGMTLADRDIAFDRLVLSDYASNSSAWDEIRWGTTFDSVTIESFLPAVPVFESQPGEYVGFVGDTVTLSASAPADPEPEYLWEFSENGEDGWEEIEGATSSVLQIPAAPYSANGYYRAVATNENGSATSDPALVDLIFPAPTITRQPSSVFAEEGSTAEFSVEATGIGTLTYQWFKDFEELEGETSPSLVIENVGPDHAGQYSVDILDHAAEDHGEAATWASSVIVTLEIIEPWDGLVSHDPFDTAAGYAAGSLADQDPGIPGYDGPWAITDGFGPISPIITEDSLTYPDPLYLGSSGAKAGTPADMEGINATNSGRVGRPFSSQLMVTDATTGTRYLSWLFRSGMENAAPNPQVYQTLALFNGPLGTDGNRDFEAGIAIGAADFNTTNFAFKVDNNTGMVGNLGVPSDSNVHLFVAKFELSDEPGGDSVTVWIDPALGGGEPEGGVTVTGADLLWDRLALSDYASDSSTWDEIRWGSTFDSVTLNPDGSNDFPSWIALYPGVGAQNGFGDDPDGDGLVNGLESFLGTDPSAANAGAVSEVAVTGGTLSFQHPRNPSPPADVAASYQWSRDLGTWHDDGASDDGTTVSFTASQEPGTTTVTAAVSGAQPAKLFVRLRASSAP